MLNPSGPVHDLSGSPSLSDRVAFYLRETFKRTMLPVGYPKTVHPNYLKFNLWSFVQGVAGSASGVLSTQCLLVGLGMSNQSVSAAVGGGSIALAATLNWVLKDGIGNLGGILFVSRFGSRFDKDAKRYRFLSAAAMNISTVLEILVPLLPALFLPLASLANTCKSVSWMANSATRAQIQRHFTRIDNLGDLTGKAASLNTASVVAGTGLGVMLSAFFLGTKTAAAMTPLALVLKCLIISSPLIMVYMWANYQGCRLGVSPRLSLQRIDKIMRGLASSLVGEQGRMSESMRLTRIKELGRYVLDPTAVGGKESFLYWNIRSVSIISLEPPISTLAPIIITNPKLYGAFFNEHKFIAAYQQDARLAIWFSDETSIEQMMSDLLSVYIAKLMYEGQVGKSSIDWMTTLRGAVEMVRSIGNAELVGTMRARGWDLDDSDLDRHPILLAPSPKQ